MSAKKFQVVEDELMYLEDFSLATKGYLQKRLQVDWNTLDKILDELVKEEMVFKVKTSAGMCYIHRRHVDSYWTDNNPILQQKQDGTWKVSQSWGKGEKE